MTLSGILLLRFFLGYFIVDVCMIVMIHRRGGTRWWIYLRPAATTSILTRSSGGVAIFANVVGHKNQKNALKNDHKAL